MSSIRSARKRVLLILENVEASFSILGKIWILPTGNKNYNDWKAKQKK